MRYLILYKKLGSDRSFRNSVKAHLEMFEYLQDSKCIYWNVANGCPGWLKAISVDVIVLHTTLLSARYGDRTAFRVWKKGLSWLEQSSAIKIAFPQDERYYSSSLCDWLHDSGVDLVYSPVMFKPEGFRKIYGSYAEETRFESCLTGYIDVISMPKPDFSNWDSRSMDVIYRAKTLPLWVGKYGALKSLIHTTLLPLIESSSLKFDISADVKDTKFGSSWTNFLADAKLIVGAEAGGSGNDNDGAVTDYILDSRLNGKSMDYDELDRKFPGWDGHDFLVIGPRHLEAAALGTCQVLVEGEYCGILKAGEHYIPVAEDLSDLCQKIEEIDWQQAKTIAINAHAVVSEKPELTYAGFSERVAKNVKEIRDSRNTCENHKVMTPGFQAVEWVGKLLRRLGLVGQLPHLSRIWLLGKWERHRF